MALEPFKAINQAGNMSTSEVIDSNVLYGTLWETLRERDLGKKEDKIKSIIRKDPNLISRPIEGCADYEGQTPLHIAVARKELGTVKLLLKEVGPSGKLDALLNSSATGKAFEGTVMSGQIVLSIAALTFNRKTVKLLLRYGARVEAVNRCNENMFHSLVSYATAENENQVWEMIDFIVELLKDSPTLMTAMWWETNTAGYTPLLLAVKYGHHGLFTKILAIPNAFSTTRLTDGMNDVTLVDVTQIDTVALDSYRLLPQESPQESSRHTKSVMKILFTLNHRVAEAFADIPAIRKCVEIKWKRYRYPYFIWTGIHLILLASVCLAAVKRSGGLEAWSPATSWVPLIFNLLYSLVRIVMVWFQIRDSVRSCPATELHNVSYMFLMILSSSAAFIDHIWFFIKQATSLETNVFMTLVILADFTFLPFFLRTFKHFSFFTVMIQRVIYIDIFRFVIFILLNLLTFSILIYIVSGVARGDDGSGFVNITSDLSKLMFGLEDLNLDEPNEVWLVQILYYFFLISTYILAMNALIALMSGTCSNLAEKKVILWRIQMLSVIVFLDRFTFLPKCIRVKAGRRKDKNDKRTWIELKVAEMDKSAKKQQRHRSSSERSKQRRNVVGTTSIQSNLPKLLVTDMHQKGFHASFASGK